MDFRVDLDVFRGPLDLLLYLVRKHEVDISDIPISLIADQYLEYLGILEKLDINAVGDFLEMASLLIEIKSRTVLPRCEEEEETLDDPRQELVAILLEYKKYKDAASILEERSRQWQQRYSRVASDVPTRKIDLSEQPIHEVELWDLVSALGRVMRDNVVARPSNIVYDDTPIQTYMQRIHQRLLHEERVAFSELFAGGIHKSGMIGIFLAILELARHHNVRAEQDSIHGEIWVMPSANFRETLALEDVDTYEHKGASDDGGPSTAVAG